MVFIPLSESTLLQTVWKPSLERKEIKFEFIPKLFFPHILKQSEIIIILKSVFRKIYSFTKLGKNQSRNKADGEIIVYKTRIRCYYYILLISVI